MVFTSKTDGFFWKRQWSYSLRILEWDNAPVLQPNIVHAICCREIQKSTYNKVNECETHIIYMLYIYWEENSFWVSFHQKKKKKKTKKKFGGWGRGGVSFHKKKTKKEHFRGEFSHKKKPWKAVPNFRNIVEMTMRITSVLSLKRKKIDIAFIFFFLKWFNPIALKKTKIACNFGLFECSWVKEFPHHLLFITNHINPKCLPLSVIIIISFFNESDANATNLDNYWREWMWSDEWLILYRTATNLDNYWREWMWSDEWLILYRTMTK